MKKIGDFAKPIRRPIVVETTSVYRTMGVKWWGLGAYERETKIGAEIKAAKMFRVQENDLIINKIWVRHGSSGIVTSNLDGCVVSADFPTFELDLNMVTPFWLSYLFKTEWFWEACEAPSRGTSGRQRINPEKYLDIEIPLPMIDDQRRIVKRVASILDRSAEIRRLHEQIEASIADLVLNLHMQEAEKQHILLGEFLEFYEERRPISEGTVYPQVGLRAYGQGMFPRGEVVGGNTTYKHFNLVYEGAIVLSQVKGWEGALAVCPPELVGYYSSPEYRTFRCKLGCAIPEYLAFLFATPWFFNQLSVFAKGVGGRRNRIHPDQFLSLSIPMPKYEKQVELLQVFKNFDAVKSIQRSTIPEFEAFVPSILDKAFRGAL